MAAGLSIRAWTIRQLLEVAAESYADDKSPLAATRREQCHRFLDFPRVYYLNRAVRGKRGNHVNHWSHWISAGFLIDQHSCTGRCGLYSFVLEAITPLPVHNPITDFGARAQNGTLLRANGLGSSSAVRWGVARTQLFANFWERRLTGPRAKKESSHRERLHRTSCDR